jgi:hypothetical protein
VTVIVTAVMTPTGTVTVTAKEIENATENALTDPKMIILHITEENQSLDILAKVVNPPNRGPFLVHLMLTRKLWKDRLQPKCQWTTRRKKESK